MNLSRMLAARAGAGNPVRVGLIGCGKFGAMFLAQAGRTAGMHVPGIADLDPDRARDQLARINWPEERYAAASFDEALNRGSTFLTDDADALIRAPGIDVLVDATGSPAAGIRHALAAFAAGRHMVMVTVEADVLAGPLLSRMADVVPRQRPLAGDLAHLRHNPTLNLRPCTCSARSPEAQGRAGGEY